MKGSKIPCLWIAPDGTAVWFESRNACARALEVNVFSVVAAMTRGTKCASGHIIRDDGRPSVTTLSPELKSQAIIERSAGRSAQAVAQRNQRFQDAARNESTGLSESDVWRQCEAFLEERRRIAREQQESLIDKNDPDYLPADWRERPVSQKIVQAEVDRYRRTQPAKEERVRIARRKRLLHTDCAVGYYNEGDNPTICPCCGKLILGTAEKRQKHVLKELNNAIMEGLEVARYPGGIIRVSKAPTGHKMDSLYLW